MTVDYKRDHEESCVIIAKTANGTDRYHVSPIDIEESIEFITTAYALMDNACEQVYISGFTLESKNTNLSKDEILRRIRFSSQKMKKIEPVEVVYHTK